MKWQMFDVFKSSCSWNIPSWFGVFCLIPQRWRRFPTPETRTLCVSVSQLGQMDDGFVPRRRTLSRAAAEKQWGDGAELTASGCSLQKNCGDQANALDDASSHQNVTTRVSSSSAPVQITRLLFWWEWWGFYFGLFCHFSYKKNVLR